jgi:Na+/proline symporter
MDKEFSEEVYRVLARERSHEEAKQTAMTNRMLVQNLVLINGGAAIAVLAYLGVHSASGSAKLNVLLSIIFYCLGIFIALFAGLYLRRMTQESSIFWELQSYPERAEQERDREAHRQQAMKSKRWLTGLLVCSEVCFLVASLNVALSVA